MQLQGLPAGNRTRVLATFGARNSEKFDVASFGDHKRAFYLIPQNCFSFVFSPLLESQIIQYLRFYMNKNAFDKKPDHDSLLFTGFFRFPRPRSRTTLA